jgi:FMN phosphatase YigB (HAD superfamily)
MTTRLVSFDIWDTVLRRDCHPEQIKLEMADFLATQVKGGRTPRRIYLKRLSIEQALAAEALREGRAPDSNFLEVHRRLLCWMSGRGVDKSLLRRMLEREVELEIAHTYVDRDVRSLLDAGRSNSGRVVYISDFYMPGEWLSRVLDAKGVLPLFDAGYVSIDHGATKHAGDLFDVVRRLENVSGDMEWLHYGDNGHSDVSKARERGVTGVLFQPEGEHALRLQKEARFGKTHGLRYLERLQLKLEHRFRLG